MLIGKFSILIIWHLFLKINSDEKIETFCNINGKRAVNSVSEKFLSISIDPAVLLAGLNLSENSLRLAKHLSPAYIRLAGPSTEFVKYVDEDRPGLFDGNSVIVTPSMWFGINEWLALTNLTPIFGINDADSAREVWNPKSTLALLEISDKLNVSCYWQLGFDSSSKTDTRYKQDLNILHELLTAFPERNESWKIVGGDISHISEDRIINTMEHLRNIVTAVMWEPNKVSDDSFLENEFTDKILSRSKSNIEVWTAVPKSSGPITFASALLWAKQVGNAAKTGYNVVFRQPRMHELFSDTPAYWFSLLHKKLMGSNVLEARTTTYCEGTSVYAHCTRKQNSFVRRGALTVMVVNDNQDKYKLKVKLGTTLPEKTMEVQEYLLTSTALNSTEILLNEKLLTSDVLLTKDPFIPKVRRAKTPSHISISVPPMSIGFFVLPGARVPVCIDQEKETDLLLEEMEEDQNAPIFEEMALTLGSRGSFGRNHVLEEITQHLKQEMQSDEKYYNNISLKSRFERIKEVDKSEIADKVKERGRKFFIDRARLAEKQKKSVDLEKKREELKKFLMDRSRVKKPETKIEPKSKNLDLTSEEAEIILKQRSKARAAQRNIIFTDEELDALVQKASKKFSNSRIQRGASSEIARPKRDINMQLLERKLNSDPYSLNDHNEFHKTSKNTSKNRSKRSMKQPRGINMKMVDYKSKLADSRMKMQDKRDEIIGNAQTLKENIKTRMQKLKHKNSPRFRRDINMDLLKIKSEGQKKKTQKKESKPMFKNQEEKEATIRKPGQTSAELFEQLDEVKPDQEKKVPTKTDVYAELADPDYEEENDGFFDTTPKSRKHGMFDKKPKTDPFTILNPTREIIEPPTRNMKNKKKTKSEDQLQFLTSSQEFTDIEDDLPCIHEYFGDELKTANNQKGRKSIHELGEYSSVEKNKRKHAKQSKKTEASDSMDIEEEFRRKRSYEETPEKLEDYEIITNYTTLSDLIYPEEKFQQMKQASKEYDDLSVEPLIRENQAKTEEGYWETLPFTDNGTNQWPSFVPLENLTTSDDLDYNKNITAAETNVNLSSVKQNDQEVSDFIGIENTIKDNVGLNEKERDKGQTTNDNSDRKNLVKTNGSVTAVTTEMPTYHDNHEADDMIEFSKPHQANRDMKNINEELNGNLSARNTEEFEDNSSSILQATRSTDKPESDTSDVAIEADDIENDSVQQDTAKVRLNKPSLSEDFRHKRERIASGETKHFHTIRDELKSYQKDMKEHLKEFKQMLAKDKLKFEEEKKKNRLKLLQLKKKQEDTMSQEADDILGQIHNDDNEKRNDMFEQLKMLKKKLQQRKSEIDAMLMKDLHDNEKIGEEQVDLMQDMLNVDKHALGKISKDIGKAIFEPADKLMKSTLNINGAADEGGESSRSKRSLFEAKKFGTYQPLTLNLKSWSPADIRSLKRDAFLGSNKITPPNDYHIFKNIYDQYRHYALRRRRSIDHRIEGLENEIDGYMNEIKKHDRISYPKFDFEKKDYKMKLLNKDLKKEGEDVTTNAENVEQSSSIPSNIHELPSKEQTKTDEKLGEVIATNVENREITNSTSSNIQEVPSKEQIKTIKNFLTNITAFLSKLGKELGTYLKHLTFN